MPKKLTKDEFVKRAEKIHGNKYDYSESVYVNSATKIQIFCKTCQKSFEQTPNNHLSNHGCMSCGYDSVKEKNSLNIDEFTRRAKEVHGNKFEYHEVKYSTNSTKVRIFCNNCQKFFYQPPNSHLAGNNGCKNCSKTKKLTKEEFIKRSREIHGNEFDYSKVEIINCTTKVKIICKNQHETEVLPSDHFSKKKHGCKVCYNDSKKMTLNEFIKISKSIHGDIYNYSCANYISSKVKLCIICPNHGEYWQTPRTHIMSKIGCPMCSKVKAADKTRWTTDFFIKKAKKIHGDKYNYSLTEYFGSKNKVKIICPKHDEVMIRPDTHLNGFGCIKCTSSMPERTTETFLTKAKIKYISQKTFKTCFNPKTKRRLRFDFYLLDYNLLLETDGPQHFFKKNNFSKRNDFSELIYRDRVKNQWCKDNNIKLLRIPFTKFDKIEEILKKELSLP